MAEDVNAQQTLPRLHGELLKIIVTPKAVFLVINQEGKEVYVPLTAQQLGDVPQALVEAAQAYKKFETPEKPPAFLH